ncbi:Post-transcriptional regulator [Gracilibacillus ureilyticus]|uniref:Post-transcriptional regulator n=1 Tax=Gracilibacillus ureilyticus TaxID=531814 RepID=A0A1H9RMM2_9BACI|nr:post-transcriptional regulator [Gracilibacillus ureilyticus]SER73857.1 Post-transcriptional regulator [Gracilibacillus ureilyticus]
MCEKKPVTLWKPELTDVIESKVTEFQLLDYSKATADDVWKCLVQKVWKGDPEKRLAEVVQDILHLHSNIYMSYLTQQSFQDTSLQESIEALFGKE